MQNSSISHNLGVEKSFKLSDIVLAVVAEAALLLVNGDYLLLENGDKLLLEG